MNICQDHWNRLRELIDERGLMPFVPEGGETAALQTADRLERAQQGEEETTVANFNPLMDAFWALGANAMRLIGEAGANPLYLMTEGPEDKVDPFQFGFKAKGRTWPKCGICYLGLAHELTCNEGDRCSLPLVDGYAWMLERAADDQLEKAKELGLL